MPGLKQSSYQSEDESTDVEEFSSQSNASKASLIKKEEIFNHPHAVNSPELQDFHQANCYDNEGYETDDSGYGEFCSHKFRDQ
ncbi:hypothetical protein CDAR_124951 [Caerostris darwini]|uniref:Uncharacterized protein n=1 Tax=Caerostris darwini TaxID=1538125 RepID=A0AAV4TGN2_9ARAC|nr:hypothetical protein CDAR_124951 [Caerostris darwini]